MKENKNVSFDDEQAETVNEAVRETEIQNDSDVDISVVESFDETLNEIEIESDEMKIFKWLNCMLNLFYKTVNRL